jgi:hypothetical protein
MVIDSGECLDKREIMQTYSVMRMTDPVQIDGRWEKHLWVDIPHLSLGFHMGDPPEHFPGVRAKLAYDLEMLYVIFQVEDRYVCARNQSYQEPVYQDSCVEFFFTPGENISEGYFNLEVNCGGTALFHHQLGRQVEDVPVSGVDFHQIQIAHTLPKVIEEEITESITWVVEYCLPFSVLAKYAPLAQPGAGITWRANFYKCADKSSHPHWLTWSRVDLPAPDFHSPEFFGRLIFG